jgi:hypothetical protein
MSPPLAHLGHWYVSTPIYLGPIVLVWLWVKLGNRRERRRKDKP